MSKVQESRHRGYPQYPPGVTGLQRLLYRLIYRVGMEASNLAEVDARNKRTYIGQRISRLKTIIQVRAGEVLDALFARLNAKIAHSQAYQLEMLGEIHSRLLKSHRPRPYPGPVALFRAEKQPLGIHVDPTLGWGALIEGELEVYELPGHPIGLLSEPRVRVSAAIIKAALEKAQERVQ
jgi:thioesterase domain-containing protein